MTSKKPVHLAAADREDLAAISALVQDAVVKVGEMAHLPSERRFALVGNRYMWERKPGFLGPGLRVRSGLHFDDVVSVSARNIRMDAKDAVLNLLDIAWDGDENGGAVTLRFAAGGAIKLEVEAINVELRDLSEPWRASSKPRHEGV
ncbi:DUF2948 family protein [Parvularcula maris]|uniref:DUF2948 family protein n=1 Tax=Parvularcula maris TaxID=2965077 RepID=A0A9X2LBB1_9PROT|nr:DUF2948 family protein [Parvularcula maris]MCQ8186530.1 DUF2948 family protein [Parvularcula maris]